MVNSSLLCRSVCYNLLATVKLISSSGCKTNYHNNYSVQNGIRTYYPGVPEYIQVGEHQFVERSLVYHWIDLMLTAWYVHIAALSI